MSENTELKTFKDALQSRLDLMDRIVENAVKIEDNGGVVVNAEAATDFRKALAESQELKTHISALEGYDEVKAWAAAPAGPSAATGAAFAGFTAQTQSKTLGEMFIDSDQFKDMISSGGFNSKEFVVEGNDLGQMGAERKDVYTALAPTLTSIGFGHTQFDPLVPRQFRKMRVRDLFSVAQTSSNLIDFFRVTGFGTDRLDLTTSASTVPEYESAAFGLKPQSSLSFEADQAPVRTIAHWEAAHRNVLQDEPQLRSVIDNELLYGLRLEEDHQILNGVGTGNDLKGLLKTDNIQLYSQGASATGETKLDALRKATTKVILANYEATGFVMHPYDWEDVELTRGADGHYVLVTNVAIGAQQQVWRQPVVDSAAMTQGKFLTGAFGLGAQLYDRMQASIRVAEQHADFFIRNAVVILAEERLALACKRPESPSSSERFQS